MRPGSGGARRVGRKRAECREETRGVSGGDAWSVGDRQNGPWRGDARCDPAGGVA